MVSLSDAKTLGGIGSILMLVSIIPSAFGVLWIVGLVLVLISVKYISEVLEDKTVFNNLLISVILVVIGVIITAAVAIFSYISMFRYATVPWMGMGPRFYESLIAVLLALIPLWIFSIISTLYLRKSYNTIASRLNINMFSTTGTLYLVGAVLTIVFVGFIIIFVAEILQAVAFFSIPEKVPQAPQPAG